MELIQNTEGTIEALSPYTIKCVFSHYGNSRILTVGGRMTETHETIEELNDKFPDLKAVLRERGKRPELVNPFQIVKLMKMRQNLVRIDFSDGKHWHIVEDFDIARSRLA